MQFLKTEQIILENDVKGLVMCGTGGIWIQLRFELWIPGNLMSGIQMVWSFK